MRSSAQCSENLRSSASTSARCSSTPRTRRTAYASGGAGCSLEQRVDAEVAHLELVAEAEGPLPSFAAASRDGHVRDQARARYSPVRVSTLMLLARLDEQRHLHDEPGLERRRLAGARDAVALHARLGLGDGELDRGGELDADDRRRRTCAGSAVSPSLRYVDRAAEVARSSTWSWS